MTPGTPRTYRMRVVGHLDDRWSSWLGGFTIDPCDDGTCTLTGPVADQAQLHGILARLRDIGATLLSVRGIEDAEDTSYVDGSATGQQPQLVTPADCGATVVDAELRVDALRVGTQGVDRHEQVSGDLGAAEVGGKQLEDLDLTHAE